jgi:hypothetical protein
MLNLVRRGGDQHNTYKTKIVCSYRYIDKYIQTMTALCWRECRCYDDDDIEVRTVTRTIIDEMITAIEESSVSNDTTGMNMECVCGGGGGSNDTTSAGNELVSL